MPPAKAEAFVKALKEISLEQARRLALAAQGFTDPRPLGRVDVRHLRRVLRRIGLVQIDSVNVLARAHYVPFFSRLGPYPPRLLDELAYRRRELFEYWGHAASLIPMAHYPLFRHRMEREFLSRRTQRLMRDAPDYIDAVREEIKDRGSLSVSELSDPGTRTGSWWGYGKGKIALEQLCDRGELAVTERRNFARVYDLAERVVPSNIRLMPGVGREDAERELIRLAARSLGIATAEDLQDYYRLGREPAQVGIAALVDADELVPVRVTEWSQPAYMAAGARMPRTVRARALVSPFDPVIWSRQRMQRLFGFDYRIEIYGPAAKRRHGYYVLPFLLGDTLVARVDLKADRRARTLRVQGAFVEPSADPDRVAGEVAAELRSMADWLSLESVAVVRRGDLAPALSAAMKHLAGQ